eukprot:scaffold163829_cov51-Attheya_sp.AAC.1
MDWLFGIGDESESDDEEDKEETDRKSPSQHTKSSEPVTEGWGSTFGKVDEDSWKCDACMLNNKGSATMCTACETPKPGCEGKATNAVDEVGTVVPTASIGAGGFSFGGSSTSGSIGIGGFSFGGSTSSSAFGSTPASAAPVDTGTQGGLSFGGVSVPATAPSTGEFSFGTKAPSGDALSGGLSFGKDFGGSLEATTDTKIKSDSKSERISPSEPMTPTHKGQSTAPLSPAAQTAASAFDKLDTDKNGGLHIDQLGEVLDELGEGFYGDEFDKQVAIIDPDKKEIVDRTTFINWYSDLVADKNGDDESSLDSAERAERDEEMNKA